MNVNQLALKVRDYARANYIKTEVMSLIRYVRTLAPNKKTMALGFMDDARELVYTELGETLPPTLPAGSAPVANAATVSVRNSAGADAHPATAVVTAGALTGVNLAATAAMVDNADTIQVLNSASADAHAGAAVVAAGVVTGVTLASTVAMVDSTDTPVIQRSNGTAVGAAGTVVVTNGVLTAVRPPATTALAVAGAQTGITVTGTYTANVSFTVANGAITGITLS